MGKTKWQNDYANEPSGYKRGRKSQKSYAPGRFERQTAEELSIAELWEQFLYRLRRQRAALRFRIYRFFSPLFDKRNLRKGAILAVTAYALLGNSLGLPFVSRNETARTVGLSYDASEETASLFDVSGGGGESGGKPKGKKFAPPKTDAAPVSADDIDDPEIRAYVQRFYKIAMEEMNRYGVPASINLGQGLIESRAGKSKLAVQNNNHFGMKCFSKKCRKGHCSNHFDDHHKDFFRIYKSPWESWRAHSVMLSSGRYAQLKKNGRDYKKWAQGLKKLGYATDKNYDHKLIDMIERYKLYRYDK